MANDEKKTTLRLMPDEDTLNYICVRANYLSYCQRNYRLKSHPSPIGNGWTIVEGRCRPVRNSLPELPVDLNGDDQCLLNCDVSSAESDCSNEPELSSSDIEYEY